MSRRDAQAGAAVAWSIVGTTPSGVRGELGTAIIRLVTLQVISTVLAAFAAFFAAVSSLASLKSTQAVEENVRLARSRSKHDLFRSFEADLTRQFQGLWECFGPWDDGLPRDLRPSDRERQVVHELLQTLSSIYLAGKLELLEDEQRSYEERVFLYWLSTPQARQIWEMVFRQYVDTWPEGFPEWIDLRLSKLHIAATPLGTRRYPGQS
jgi:hypothetical protein